MTGPICPYSGSIIPRKNLKSKSRPKDRLLSFVSGKTPNLWFTISAGIFQSHIDLHASDSDFTQSFYWQ